MKSVFLNFINFIFYNCLIISITILTTSVSFAHSGTIDFEMIPGSQSVDKMEISDQFEKSHGVSFKLSNDKYPKLAQKGGTATAFYGPSGGVADSGPDSPAKNQQVGNFFLTDDEKLGASGNLIIMYSNPVSSASGVLIDIDHTEKWEIVAYDDTGNEIQKLQISDSSSEYSTGDGIATIWSFNRNISDIHSIEFIGSRTESGDFGLAFDNFSPSTSLIAPIANAGKDQVVCKDTVKLDASQSYDPYGAIISFYWEIRNTTQTFELTAESMTPTINNIIPGFYDIQLTVKDSDNLTATDYMKLAVGENPCSYCDVDNDKKIGLKEAIYSLKITSGIIK